MKILEYNDVDPLQVLQLNMLALDFPLTAEQAAHIRRTDPRPFPCFTVHAVEHGLVVGQVGIFRLPMISIDGREDVGGVWAVSTHPGHTQRGIASALLEETHTRMRAAGLRFSTLGTNRYRVAYKLYQKHGYQDMRIHATALANWETAHQPTRLNVEPPDGHDAVERIFAGIAKNYLGFAWRHMPFERLRKVHLADIWVLQENGQPVGYALVRMEEKILIITDLALKLGTDAAEAVAAIAAKMQSTFVQVKISRPADIASLRRAGYLVAHPSWEAFMIKPLLPAVNLNDARRLFGIGTDRFLMSWLDVT